MASLEGRKVKYGTTWRVIYYWQGSKEKLQLGITTRRVAQQQKAKVEALLADRQNPKKVLELQNASDLNLTELLAIDSAWCEHRRRPRTIQMTNRFGRLLIDFTGDIKVNRVDKSLFEQFITHLQCEKHHTHTTVNIGLRVLKALFNRAVEEHLIIASHPFKEMKPLASKRNDTNIRFLNESQVSLLLNQIEAPKDLHFRRVIQFYLWTGCRWTEAMELKWDDVDWQNQVFNLGHPDSQTKLRRAFPMTDHLNELLRELQQDAIDHGASVFWRFSPNPYYVSWRIRKIRTLTAGLPIDLTIHMFRHTFASHLVMKGVDLTTVAKLMGHSTTKVTELYAHLQPDHKKNAAERLPF